jgi:hypothetical protein
MAAPIATLSETMEMTDEKAKTRPDARLQYPE